MKYFGILNFFWNFSNIFNLVIKTFFNEIHLFEFYIFPKDIYKLKFIVVSITIHRSFHSSNNVTSLISHVVANIYFCFKSFNAMFSFDRFLFVL